MALMRAASGSLRQARPTAGALKGLHFILAIYVLCKMIAYPARLIQDASSTGAAWDSHVGSETAQSCNACLQRALTKNNNTGGDFIELTTCFNNHGGSVSVNKPGSAKEGGAVETWEQSWNEYGKDWWDQDPLEPSLARFDDRIWFANRSRTSMVRAGLQWVEVIVIILFILLGLLLFFFALAAPPIAIIISSAAIAAWSPIFAIRLSQSLGWYSEDGCMLVGYDDTLGSSLYWWMLAFFFVSIGCSGCGKNNSNNNGDQPSAPLMMCNLCEVLFCFIAWVLSLVHLSQIKGSVPGNEGIFNAWMIVLSIGVVDCIPLTILYLFLTKLCLRVYSADELV